nr:alpha,alpha-trehalose-phosphate synthase [UDP-forming] [Halyomorpha halys]
MNHWIKYYLSQKNIRHENTVYYTLGRNSVVERADRTVLETTRCLLACGGLPASSKSKMYSPKLIVVSNRLPFVLKQNSSGVLERVPSAGGLVTAVGPVVIQGNGLWVGWPGPNFVSGTKIPESSPEDASPSAGLLSDNIVPVEIDQNLMDNYYNGCCNATFWPLFHLMPDRAVFNIDYWQAAELKKYNFKLAFFLHIPFPPWDILRIFPWVDDLLQGLLGNDMLGFHTRDYCINFIECCRRGLKCRVDTENLLVEHGARTIKVCILPIGVPYERFQELARTAPSVIKEPDMKLILGVDRLDYTKGIQNRLLGIERLFEKKPDLIGKVTVLQIAVPSRQDVKEYQDLKESMDKLVGNINGKFSTPKWSPIRYIFGTVRQEELAGYYRDSDVALITPLRDGMNLVAKEFVSCQIKDPPGVLIISPFAGAAEQMEEALIANPYEIDDIADTLIRALEMPNDEKTLRINYLRQREQSQDVHFWMKSFLQAMSEIVESHGERIRPTLFSPVSFSDFDIYCKKILQGKKQLALLLDFDGTLAPLVQRPELAELPAETKEILLRLSQNPRIQISIVSGRHVKSVMEKVGIKNITYAGNHGMEIIQSDGSHFMFPMPLEYQEKASQLVKDLQEQVVKEGAWVENKGLTLTLHYRETPFEWRAEIVSKARTLIESAGFIASHAHKALEAKPPINWNKGRACIYILRTAFGLNWSDRLNVIYVGDDTTDEDAMRALKGMAISFRITLGLSVKTAADHRLQTTDCVVTLLKWVEEKFKD